MRSFVLDTHAFLWLLEGNAKLPTELRRIIQDPATDLYLPALVVAEMVDLICKSRSHLDLLELRSGLAADGRLAVVPMGERIALATAPYFARLPHIHDRCIVATTAMLLESGHDAVLVTRDKAIRESALVPTIWD